MYSKKEVSKYRHEFWITLGKYLAPIPSADGEDISWINYKTGVRKINFKMFTKKQSVRIGIFITSDESETRKQYFEQFRKLQKFLEATLDEKWDWSIEDTDENDKRVSSISHKMENVSVLNKEDWPVIISFFKSRIIALDKFWSVAKYDFET